MTIVKPIGKTVEIVSLDGTRGVYRMEICSKGGVSGMSKWTHISGVVRVWSEGRTQPELRYVVESVVDHLPVVTGTEGDMEVHIVQCAGYNTFSSHDEFGSATNNLRDECGKRSREHGYHRTQDQYLLVLDGDLRDRTFERTYREFTKWLCRLAKRLIVDYALVEIKEDYGKRVIITDENSRLMDMLEPYSDSYMAKKLKKNLGIDSKNWCERLLRRNDESND